MQLEQISILPWEQDFGAKIDLSICAQSGPVAPLDLFPGMYNSTIFFLTYYYIILHLWFIGWVPLLMQLEQIQWWPCEGDLITKMDRSICALTDPVSPLVPVRESYNSTIFFLEQYYIILHLWFIGWVPLLMQLEQISILPWEQDFGPKIDLQARAAGSCISIGACP